MIATIKKYWSKFDEAMTRLEDYLGSTVPIFLSFIMIVGIISGLLTGMILIPFPKTLPTMREWGFHAIVGVVTVVLLIRNYFSRKHD